MAFDDPSDELDDALPVGLVARRVGEALAVLRDAGELDEMGEAKAAIALNLAAKLDSGAAVMASAAIAGQLRETLAELRPEAPDDGDDDFTEWGRELGVPSAVRDPKD